MFPAENSFTGFNLNACGRWSRHFRALASEQHNPSSCIIAAIPAIIVCDPKSATLRIAGLLVVDRLVVAAHRAGAKPVFVVTQTPLPSLDRTVSLGIPAGFATRPPGWTGPTLVLSTNVLIQTADLKALIASPGRLAKPDGTLLPAGIVRGPLSASLEEQLCNLPTITARGVAELVAGDNGSPAASRALWSSLSSSADGFVDKHFNRPVGRLLSKLLVHTPVSPNQVSVAATLLGLLSAWLFARGSHTAALWGAIALQISAIVDCVDGDLARVLFKESPLGKWLDIVGDQAVHIGVFVAIGVGLHRAGSEAPVMVLAASAAIGVAISFIIVMRGLLQPESQRNTRLQKLIDATTNRDFSVLLIVLVLFGNLEWFLWMTAIGVHVFWLLALGVQLTNPPAQSHLKAHGENRS